MTAIFLPLYCLGLFGLTKFSLKAFSMMASSLFLILTLFPLIAHTQESSQGAGQTRPRIQEKDW